MKKKGRLKQKSEDRLTSPFLDRYPHLILIAILSLALILRILALLSLKESIYFDYLLWDERVYHEWALKIANGTPVLSTYGFAPVPAYIMALTYKIFSPDILYIRIMNILLGVLTCHLVYLIGKEMLNRLTGLIASLIACLYKPFIFYSIVPLKTSLSVFLFALTIYIFLSVLRRYSMIKAVLLGLVIGLMLNVRPNCIIIIPFLPLLFIWNMCKDGAPVKGIAGSFLLYFAGILISVFPFVMENFRVSGELKFTTSQTGYALYIGNNLDNPDPYFRPVPFASPSPFEQGTQMIIEASRREGRRLSAKEGSYFWTRETMKIAKEQPGAFMWKIWQKVLVFFNRFEAGDHYHIGFMSRFVTFFKLPFLGFWIILPFGMSGMAVNILRSRRFLFTSLILFLYGLTLVVFFTDTRFRLPMMVLLIPYTVIGVRDMISYMKDRDIKMITVCISIVAVLFAIEYLPVRGTDDLTAYYNTHAIILDSKGFKDEAIKYWEESSFMNKPYSAFANLSLAGKYYGKRDRRNALSYLEKIPEDSFAASYKYEIIGDIMLGEGQIKDAISAYQRSLEINSGRREVRTKLIKVYWRTDREKAMKEYDTLEYIISFYPREMLES